jgi:hypothetical protein
MAQSTKRFYDMKIHQLPLGARFEYQGEEYVKTAALFATGKAGPRLIPKYAVLKPLDQVEAVSHTGQNETLPRAAVLKAFGTFYTQCVALVPDNRRGELETARAAFLKVLP